MCFCCAAGAEAEAEVRTNEEAAVLHRERRAGTARLPAGQPQLDGPLLVQVRLLPAAPLQHSPANHSNPVIVRSTVVVYTAPSNCNELDYY